MGHSKIVPRKVDLLTDRAQEQNKLNEAGDLKAMDTMHNEFRERFWNNGVFQNSPEKSVLLTIGAQPQTHSDKADNTNPLDCNQWTILEKPISPVEWHILCMLTIFWY